ncbi:hypothetical protein Lal_00037700 [Lupinus albus]|nr:hypothetical protein Lal_00037700 [Lupinus albus]
MRKDPRVGGGVGGTCEVTKNQTQHSPSVTFRRVVVVIHNFYIVVYREYDSLLQSRACGTQLLHDMVIIRDIVSDFSDEEDMELVLMVMMMLRLLLVNRHNLNNYFDDNVFIAIQFESKEATVNAIKQFHIRNYVDYTIVESRPDRYVGQCKHFGVGCHWRIRASINAKRNLWEIRKISGIHTCVSTCISQDHMKLNSSFITNCIIQLVSKDLGIPIKALVKEVVTRFGYTATYRKAWTTKQIAMSQIYGDWEGSYKQLPRWLNVVECYSLDTIVRYASSRHEDGSTLIIDRLPLPLSNERLKKLESSFSTIFRHMLLPNQIYIISHRGEHVYWVHYVLSFRNGVMHNQYIVFVTLLAISTRSSKIYILKKKSS